MTLAYSYVRFSSKRQEKGQSERRQLEIFEATCVRFKLTPAPEHFSDRGISAFRGKNFQKGALGNFLQLVKDSIIGKDSVLVVESLDRLSRLEPLDALDVFKAIINAGVSIIADNQLYSRESMKRDAGLLYLMVGVFHRSHDESKWKSQRLLDVNANRRNNLKKSPFNKRCPSWIFWNEKSNRFELDPKKSAILKDAIKMAIDGMGSYSIVRQFNIKNIPGLGYNCKLKGWDHTSLLGILKSKTLIGEYQPKKIIDGKRIPEGEPVKNYYPALISEADFYALQNMIGKRKIAEGTRETVGIANLFAGVLKSGHDGSTIRLLAKGHTVLTRQQMISAASIEGTGEFWNKSFPYQPFEDAFLQWVSEIDFSKVFARPESHRLEEIQGRLGEIRERLATLGGLLVTSKAATLKTIAASIERLEAEETELVKQEETAKADNHAPTVKAKDFADWHRAMATLEGPERELIRARLKAAIRSICQRVDIYIYGGRFHRLAYVHVILAENSDRLFSLEYRRGGKVTVYPHHNLKWKGYITPSPLVKELTGKWAEAELTGQMVA
jgi:DNA invertase Pin-like site-specific DNA recombinase